MRNAFKNNKGVTIMMLVITVILMLILVAFAVYYSRNTAVEATIAKEYTSLKEIKEACTRALFEIELDPSTYDEYYFFGKSVFLDGSDVDDLTQRCGGSAGVNFSERTYQLSDSTDDENKRRLERLEITQIHNTYIIDLENQKYYLLDGVKRADDTKVYEYRDIELLYSDLLTPTK